MYKTVFVGSIVLVAALCGYLGFFTPVDHRFVHVSGKDTKRLAGWMVEVKSFGWPFVHATYCEPQVAEEKKYWRLHYASMAMNVVLWGVVSIAVAHTAAIAVVKGLRWQRRNRLVAESDLESP